MELAWLGGLLVVRPTESYVSTYPKTVTPTHGRQPHPSSSISRVRDSAVKACRWGLPISWGSSLKTLTTAFEGGRNGPEITEVSIRS